MPGEATQPVEREVRSALAQLGLLREQMSLAVAYSGGQDSTCLLAAVLRVLPRSSTVQAIHVDHGIRPESGPQARQLGSIARELGAEAEVVRVDVPAFRALLGNRPSLQQAARIARYWALGAACSSIGADALLVGHTADDQAETVLLRLLRGAGLAGLAGMRMDEWVRLAELGPCPPELRSQPLPEILRVVRPLLSMERVATAAYCAEAGLQVVEDASNRTRVYTRNQVRLDLLPMLERFNPAIRTVLSRTARLAADDQEALDRLAERTFHDQASVLGEAVEFPLAAWRKYPRALRRRLLRRAVEQLAGTVRDVPFEPVEAVLDLLESAGASRSHHLPWGLEVRTRRETFVVRRRTAGVYRDSGEPCL